MIRLELSVTLRIRLAIGLCTLASVGATAALADEAASANVPRSIARDVYRFDFDETARGNFERRPMHWEPIRAAGYPPFLAAVFDPAVGHPAPPSVRLAVQGGSVGLTYAGRAIPVHADSDYRVQAWVRLEGLRHARLRVVAFLRDADMQPIPGATADVVVLPAHVAAGEWRPIELTLIGGFAAARWFGLTAAVEQPDGMAAFGSAPRPIARHDVHGAAWIDDVRISRLPQLSVDAVCASRGPAPIADGLDVCVRDASPSDLAIRLIVRDAAGAVVRDERFGVPRDGGTQRIGVGDLPIGVYRAAVTIQSGDDALAERGVTFLRTPASADSASARVRGSFLGVDLGSEVDTPALDAIESLMAWVGMGAAKLPMWDCGLADEELVRGLPRREPLLRRLKQRGMTVVGTFVAAPDSLAERFPVDRRGVVDVLASEPAVWQPYLAFPLLRVAGWVDAWQLGADGRPLVFDERFALAAGQLAAETARLAPSAALVTGWPGQMIVDRRLLPIDGLSLELPGPMRAAQVADAVEAARAAGVRPLWARLANDPAPAPSERAAIGALLKRIVAARAAGAERVFIDAPWSLGADGSVEPSLSLIPLRQLVARLGAARPVGPISLGENVTAYLFAGANPADGLLVAWSDVEDGESHVVQRAIGRRTRRDDLWGSERVVESSDAGQQLMLSDEPAVFAPVDPILLAFQDCVALNGDVVEAGEPPVERTLVFRNPLERRVTVRAELDAPRGWTIRPGAFEFELSPGGTYARPLRIVLPRNAPAGEHPLPLRLIVGVGGDVRGVQVAPIARVGLRGLDVHVMVQRVETNLLIQARITNRSESVASLAALVLSPEHPRETRRIDDLAPGASVVSQMTLDRADLLAGRSIRLLLRRTTGPETYNAPIELGPAQVARVER